MRKLLLLIPLAGILLAALYHFLSRTDAGRELLAQAVEAHGGEAGYQRTRIGTVKGVGLQSLAHDVPFTWEETFHLPDRLKRVLRMPTHQTALTQLAANGKYRVFDGPQEVSSTPLEEVNDLVESTPDILGRLVMAMRRKTEITLIDEIEVQGRPAAGIEVDQGAAGKVQLYFDRQSHRVVKMTRHQKLPEAGTVWVELFPWEYQVVDGVAIPYKMRIYREGQLSFDMTVKEVKFVERLDDSVFAGP